MASIGWAAKPTQRPSSLPRCRHENPLKDQDGVRRAQALMLARAINAAQADAIKRTGEYQPLAILPNLPAAPAGFQVSLYAGRSGYIFSLKDKTDPCHFAVFSDAGGLLYQQQALAVPLIAQ
jgi:hypothetical protein